MHNLGTVFKFEVIRTLKKKTFWITALSFPLIMFAVFGIILLSNQATEDAVKDMSKQRFSSLVLDESGLVKTDMLAALEIKTAANRAAGIEAVQSSKADAFFYYPADLTKGIEIYGKDVGIFQNGRYDSVARTILEQSVGETVNPNIRTVISGKTSAKFTIYKDGQVYDPILQMIAPGFFLILFYFLIAMFGNQAVTSTTEEKENRVIEMLLTTVQARTVIIGKILALVVLALFQAILFIAPVAIAYAFLHNQLSMPALDLSTIPFDWTRIGVAALIFSASFMLFIGLLVAIGAATPTAKEAGSFIGIVMVLIFGPLYASSLFISSPEQPLVQALTYFPLTAPIPLLLRNAAGTITIPEVLLGLVVLTVTAYFVIRIAVRIFRFGALEYSRKLSLREIFGRS